VGRGLVGETLVMARERNDGKEKGRRGCEAQGCAQAQDREKLSEDGRGEQKPDCLAGYRTFSRGPTVA
jgi:general stress protein YciG